MSITLYNYSVTGDCSNTGVGAIYFDITGTSSPWSVFETAPTTGTFPTSGATTYYSLENIPAGTYSITITDATFVSQVYPIYISSGTCVSLDSQDTTCGSSNGSLTAYTQSFYGDGGDFYLYDITHTLIDQTLNAGNSVVFNSISAGTYYVVADDGGGCTGKSESCIVASSTTFTYGGYVVNDASCTPPIGSGKVVITGQTGNPPYTYDWSDGQTGSTATGLTAGVYSVNVTDSNGCINSQTFLVQQVNPVSIASFITTAPSCFTDDGTVEVLVVGGTPPYYFQGSNGDFGVTFSNTFTFSGLSSGVFTVNVTDAGLCTYSDSTEIMTPNGFSIVSITTNNSFCNNNDGSISIVLDAGSPGGTFTYTLKDTLGNTVSTNTAGFNYSFYPISSGTYTIEVTNAICTFSATTIVGNMDLFTISANTSGTTCGFNNGQIQIIASSGGTLPYTYQISGYPPGPISTFNNLSPGLYNIFVTDADGCQQQDIALINNSLGVYFDFFITQPSTGNDGEIDVLLTSGEPPFTFNWSTNVNGQTGTTLTGLTAGTYTLEVIDNNGCSYTKTTNLLGTTLYSSSSLYKVCSDIFQNTGLLGRRGILQMLNEGFFDLTSGDTGCILNSATFTLDLNVNGVSAQTVFYTSTGLNDYPTDEQWVNVIKNGLYGFSGITSVEINIETNKIIIKSGCITGGTGCQQTVSTGLDDTRIIINLIIDYDISCIECGTYQKVFQDDFEFIFQDGDEYIFQ